MISEGIRWSNIAEDDLGISFQTVLLVLMVDVAILTCLAVYIDAVSISELFVAKLFVFSADLIILFLAQMVLR